METKKMVDVDMDEMKQAVTRQALTMLSALEAGNAFEAMSASVNLSAKLIASVAATRPDDPQEWTAAVIELLQLRIFTEAYALGLPTAENAAQGGRRKMKIKFVIKDGTNMMTLTVSGENLWVCEQRALRIASDQGMERPWIFKCEIIDILDRLFIGKFPAGLVYADREREEHGDYKRLAFLPYDTLELEIYPGCPVELRERIIKDASTLLARAGEHYPVSTSGQTVLLGSKMEKEE
ncbi:MAG: hypothetical protein K8I29_19645 [Alphaproteobacteria bacterium]|uniref:Uncharacterized protein n=1 Tax=Candidatus Nitrobium versatile TaxID=2884831 RepID=A0A953M3Q1_9BACT|nr:hypothetical protein [Candidatus Nitrobium versatile]